MSWPLASPDIRSVLVRAAAARLPAVASIRAVLSILSGMFLLLAAPSFAQFNETSTPIPGYERSTAEWGDYDADGDLDLAICGERDNGARESRIYRNDSGTFVSLGAALVGVVDGCLAWGDDDGDGDLDLFLAGLDSGDDAVAMFYRNNAGAFANTGSGFTGVSGGGADWADADRDGDLDLIVTGDTNGPLTPLTRLYRNDGGTFSNAAAGLMNLSNGGAAFGDYDNDGDPDLILTGLDAADDPQTVLYRNDGGAFLDSEMSIVAVHDGSVAWMDANNDGDLDFALTGRRPGTVARVYRNINGDHFSWDDLPVSGLTRSSLCWGDYDADGYPDLLLTGRNDSNQPVTRLCLNTNSGGPFTVLTTSLDDIEMGAGRWGDVNNDDRLDLLITGSDGSSPVSRLYLNLATNQNSLPSSPNDLAASHDGLTATFEWDGRSDNQTPSNGLRYNIRVGTSPGANDIVASMSDNGSGFHRVVRSGNVGRPESWSLAVAGLPDTVYWSVQAIDASLAGSEFADEETFVVRTPTSLTLSSSPNPSTTGEPVLLTAMITPSATTGTIAFKDGTATLGMGVLSGGTATFSAPVLAAGNHSLTAVFAGDAYRLPSTSPVVTQVVSNLVVSSTAIQSTPNPSLSGQSVTITATVSPSNATGLVEFKDGPTSLGQSSLSGGVATRNTSSLAAGAHTLTAHYVGNATILPSDSPALPHTVNVTTTTTLLNQPNPSLLGQPVTLTATVTPAAATGTVTFTENLVPIGTATLSGGTATLVTSALTLGPNHPLRAVYEGNGIHLGSTSAIRNQSVQQPTATSLVSDPNPSISNSLVTLTATVTPAGGTGTVTFRDNGNSIASSSINSEGVATASRTLNGVGQHPLTAVYAGNGTYVGSTSPAVDHSVRFASITTLVSTPNPSLTGQNVVLTATVTPAGATGIVTFTDGATPLGSVAVSGGSAALSVPSLSAGPHALVAAYGGDGIYIASSSAPVTQNVLIVTTAAIDPTPNPSLTGQVVSIVAGVLPPTATGTITLKDGAAVIASGALVDGSVALQATFATPGTHVLTAVYSGDTAHATTTSPAVNQLVHSTTAVTLVSAPNPSIPGQSVALTATVTPPAAGGTMTFRDGAATLGTVSFTGQAILNTTSLAAGTHSLTATYEGNANYLPGTSPALSHVVLPFTDTVAPMTGARDAAAALGDCDGDADLDLLVAGDSGSGLVTRLYRNTAGVFADAGAGLPGLRRAAAAWGDYDGDGDLDLLLAGLGVSVATTTVYRNSGGVFADAGAGLPGVSDGAVAWGDCDNDGDLDLFLTGVTNGGLRLAALYRNSAGQFLDVGAGLLGVDQASAALADVDNDGDLDLAVAGLSDAGESTRLYRNDAGLFTVQATGLPSIRDGALSWCDMDADGDLDLAMAGATATGRLALIFRNEAGGFIDIGAGLPGFTGASLAWGDYDNDGDADLALSGSDSLGVVATRVHRNDGGSFTDIGAGLVGVADGATRFGDCDNDRDLDILVIGGTSGASLARLYRNNVPTANATPSAPAGLSAQLNGDLAMFSWTAAADAPTPSAGLTYNLRVGTTPGGNEILAGQSAPNGYRRAPLAGNVGHRLSWSVQLRPAPRYYWSVQAVDGAGIGSAFAAEQSPCHPMGSYPASLTKLLGQVATFSVTAGDQGPFTYAWRKNGVLLANDSRVSGATTATLTIVNLQFPDAGDYTVTATNQCRQETSLPARLGVLQAACPTPPASAWVNGYTPGPWPGPHQFPSMCYDTARNRVLVGGGWFPNSNPRDFWSWNGNQWTALTVQGLTPRDLTSIAYDSRRDRVVLFGGSSNGGYFGDTWEFDGSTWRQVASSGPAARYLGGLAYDPIRERTVLFGGLITGSSPPPETWEWDGFRWTRCAIDAPDVAGWGGLTWDPVRRRVIRISGTGNIWGWTGRAWVHEGVGLPTVNADAMAFDASRSMLVVHRAGGTWQWDGTRVLTPGWTPLHFPIYSPGMVYDPQRRRVVFFGGQSAPYLLELVVADPAAIATAPTATMRVEGLPTRLGARASGNQPLYWQWFRSGVPLIDGPDYAGTQTDSLTILNPAVTTGGQFSVTVSNTCGQASSLPVAVTDCSAGIIPPDPAPALADSGGSTTLTVTTTGPTPVAYAWRFEGTALSDGPGVTGSQSASLTLTDLTVYRAGHYDCRLTYPCGTVDYPVRRVDVCLPLTITRQPAPTGEKLGQAVSFSVVHQGGDTGASGSDSPDFQWRRDGLPLDDDARLSGTHGPVLVISNLMPSDAGAYDVQVSARCGSVSSVTAPLTILDVACGTDQWTTFGVSPMPGNRSVESYAYDTARDVLVMFGGIREGDYLRLQDTWEFDGTTWTLKATTGPSPRGYAAMCYDQDRGRVVLFGGTSNTGYMGDTWEWDGTSWSLKSTTGPMARGFPCMAFDASLGVARLFGGVAVFGNAIQMLPELWQWDGTQWSQVSTGYPYAAGRYRTSMAYDPVRGGIVVAGGATLNGYLNDTWLLKGSRWTRLNSTTPLINDPRLTFDPVRNRMILIQRAIGSAVWELVNDLWQARSVRLPQFCLPNQVAFFSNLGQLVCYNAIGYQNARRVVLDVPTAGAPIAAAAVSGAVAQLTASVDQGTPPFQFRWRRGGVDLIDGGRVSGSQTSTLVLSPAVDSDAGAYECVVLNSCGASVQAVTLAVCAAPVIVEQPSDLVLEGGQTGSLTVGVSGAVGASFQWFHDDYPVPESGGYSGSRTASLTIGPASAYHRGVYRLRLGSCTQAWSQAVTVGVTCASPLVITSQPLDLVVNVGQPASFAVTASGCGPLAYQWFRGGIALPSPEGTGAVLTIPSVAPADSGGYYVRVTDQVSAIFSRTATLNAPGYFFDQEAGQANPATNDVIVEWRTVRPAVVGLQWGYNGNYYFTVTGSPTPSTSGVISFQMPLTSPFLFLYRLVATEPGGPQHLGAAQTIMYGGYLYSPTAPVSITAIAATESTTWPQLGDAAPVTLQVRNSGAPAGPVDLLAVRWGSGALPRDATGGLLSLPLRLAETVDSYASTTAVPDLNFLIGEAGVPGGSPVLSGTVQWFRLFGQTQVAASAAFAQRLRLPVPAGLP